MTRQVQIAQFLEAFCPLPRMAWPYSLQSYPRSSRGLVYRPRQSRSSHTVEALAEHFLAVPEFDALRLGGFFSTVDGHVLAEAVELLTPPLYRQDVALLIDALTLAAEEQRIGNQRAGLIAVAAVAGSVLLAAAVSRGGGAG